MDVSPGQGGGRARRGTTAASRYSPDRVVMITGVLGMIGGGVNNVVKDQVDHLTTVHGLPVQIIAERGDFQAEGDAHLLLLEDPGNTDAIFQLLLQQICEPARLGERVSAIIHNILTTPFCHPLNHALQRLIGHVLHEPELKERLQFIAWTHDIFQVPDQMIEGVIYVAVSEERRQTMASYFHQPPERIRVVPNVVNFRRILDLSPAAASLLRTLRLAEHDFVAYYPARMARNKNFERAIRIAAALNRLGKRTLLVMTGMDAGAGDQYYLDLRALAIEEGIPEKVVFLSDLTFDGLAIEVSDSVVCDFYKLASFLLFTTNDEGFGLPLTEAGAWKLPAVIAPCPPLMDIARETGALVLDLAQSHEQMAEAIIQFLETNCVYRLQRRVYSDFSIYHLARHFEALGWNLPSTRPIPVRIGTQTTNYHPRSRLEDQFLDALHNGLDAFEIFFDRQHEKGLGFDPADLKAGIRRWLRENAEANDIRLSVCTGRRFRSTAERQRHWNESLRFASDVGAELLVIDVPPRGFVLEKHFDRFLGDLKTLIADAREAGIAIALENGSAANGSGHGYTSAESMNEILEIWPAEEKPAISFNAGRANLLESPGEYLSKLRTTISHVKISDNHGAGHSEEHLRVGRGTLAIEALFQQLQRRSFSGTIILEYFYHDLRSDRATIEAAMGFDRRGRR